MQFDHLTLTKADIDRLAALISEIPHKHAVPIVQLINECTQRQMRELAEQATQSKASLNH